MAGYNGYASRVAHKFFYSGFNDRGGENNCSYWHNQYSSYNTVIGVVFEGKKSGRTVFLLDSYNYSVTTSNHKQNLRMACPGHIDLIECVLPGKSGNYKPKDVVKANVEYAESCMRYKMTLKKNREEFLSALRVVEELNRHFGGVHPAKLKKLHEFAQQIASKEGLKTVAELQAHQEKLEEDRKHRQALAIRRKREKELAPYVKLMDTFRKKVPENIISMAVNRRFFQHVAADYRDCSMYLLSLQPNQLEAAFNVTAYSQNYAYVAPGRHGYDFDDAETVLNVETNANLQVSIHDVRVVLKAWKAKKSIRGMTLGQYTVLSTDKNLVVVGCHKFHPMVLEDMHHQLVELSRKEMIQYYKNCLEYMKDEYVKALREKEAEISVSQLQK